MNKTHDMLAVVQGMLYAFWRLRAKGKAVQRLERIEAYLIARMTRD